MTICPECNGSLQFPTDLRVGEVIICKSCQAQLEVINKNPLELVLAPEVEEDWGE
jgi:alpha-aminoadipate/glutamate carrier protein LysW